MALRAHSSCCRDKVRVPANYSTPIKLLADPKDDEWTVFSRANFDPQSKKFMVHRLVDEDKQGTSSKTTAVAPLGKHLVDFLQLNSLRLTGVIPSISTIHALIGSYRSDHFQSLQLACFSATGSSMPTECLQMIFAYVTGQMRREKMDYKDHIFDTVHHALQPCSVCHKLLAIDTDSRGEIRSSGESLCSSDGILPRHQHSHRNGVDHLHVSCCPGLRKLELRV